MSLELAILAKNVTESMEYARQSIAAVNEIREPETTMRNLRLIREAKEKRNEDINWIKEIEGALAKKTKS